MSLKECLTDEHRECDRLYAKLESFVQEDEWEDAQEAFYESTSPIRC